MPFYRSIRLQALCVLSGVLMSASGLSSANGQSFPETVNFLFTGDAATSSVQFGDYSSSLITTTVTDVDVAACTAEATQKMAGPVVAVLALLLFPDQLVAPDANSTADQPDFTIDSKIKINFNHISNWRLDPQPQSPPTFQATFNGSGDTVMDLTISVGERAEKSLQCTSKCTMSLPPEVDASRWMKAMDYLFTSFCSGSPSAF